MQDLPCHIQCSNGNLLFLLCKYVTCSLPSIVQADITNLPPLGYIAFRVYVLWDQSRKMKIILCIALAVTYIPAGVLIGFANATFYSLHQLLWYLVVYELTLSQTGNTILLTQFNSCIVTAETVLFKIFFACIVRGSFPMLSSKDPFPLSYRITDSHSNSFLWTVRLRRIGGHSDVL